MKCIEVQDLLSEYLDGEIAEPWRKQWIEQHLASCPTCCALYAELKQVREVINSLPVRPAPKEISARVEQEVENELAASGLSINVIHTEPPLGRGIFYRYMIPIGLASAAALLALFVVLKVNTLYTEGQSERIPGEAIYLAKSPSSHEVKKQVGEMGAVQSAPQLPPAKTETLGLDARMPPQVSRRLSATEGVMQDTKVELKTQVAEIPQAATSPPEDSRPTPHEVSPKDVDKVVSFPSIEPTNIIKGMIEKRTLLLRVQDVPAASAEVKNILAQCGAKVSRDYYGNGTLEGAGTRIKAEVPGRRYSALLAELRKRNYLTPERPKTDARAAKPMGVLPMQSIAETIDLTIKFEVR